MPEEDNAAGSQPQAAPRFPSRLPSVPAPIKHVFDKFPLHTYPPNDIPRRLPSHADEHTLYIFTSSRGARQGAPSYNPQCLKWQAYLKFVGIPFETVASNNHASPTGALPFLLPASSSAAAFVDPLVPIPSHKIQKWAIEQTHVEEEQQLSMRFDVYASLLDHRIRNAWLYTFYLEGQNFNHIGRKLYVDPATSNPLVRAILARQLQQAAREELLKSSSYIDVDDLEAEAKSAFQALSSLLGDDRNFFGRQDPGLFDASVFAYTHLLLDERMNWKQNPLGRYLRKHPNLVQHRQRLLEAYF
ncbi:hypothetical protein AJ79_03322 [Helicocarpus griseus UAMH5409]|uniref:GST C-terminal domain-containing protein n=1 Tax=Helicocarpus griseus UAMH5409 TaxID=1447875 RepID=A0A2B7XZK8_9EURO|nr:hypothetical protein AJ79_03322 [Helicocarpus griseus UAMH5409]